MTVIAYRNGIMAADTAGWHGDLKVATAKKIFAVGNPRRLVAAAGSADAVKKFTDWVARGGGAEPQIEWEEDEEFEGIEVTKDCVFVYGKRMVPHRSEAPFYALGSHEEFLYGAMAAGATAEEAVRACLKYGGFCGGDVQVERLGDITVSK